MSTRRRGTKCCDPQADKHMQYKMKTENTPSHRSAPASPFRHWELGSISEFYMIRLADVDFRYSEVYKTLISLSSK